jgi:hypothetical protein
MLKPLHIICDCQTKNIQLYSASVFLKSAKKIKGEVQEVPSRALTLCRPLASKTGSLSPLLSKISFLYRISISLIDWVLTSPHPFQVSVPRLFF